MMNYLSTAAQNCFRHMSFASRDEAAAPPGVANRPAQAEHCMNEFYWMALWPADDSLIDQPPVIQPATGFRFWTSKPQSIGEIATRYRDEVSTAAAAVDEGLYKLLAAIQRAAGEAVRPMRGPDPDRLLPADFAVPAKVREWAQTTRNGLAALESLLDAHSAASRAPMAADAPQVGSAAQSAPRAGAALLCAMALRRHPEMAADKNCVKKIKEELLMAKSKLEYIECRLAWDKGRRDVNFRVMMAQYARLDKLRRLREEAWQVGKAGNVAQMSPDKKVHLGHGDMRAQMLGLAVRAKDAFGAFFMHVKAALGRVLHPLFTSSAAPAPDERTAAARLQESKDAQRIAPALSALKSSAPDSLSKLSVEKRALQRAVKMGVAVEYSQVREQFLMGENLVRTLMTAKIPSLGIMVYEGREPHRGQHVVPSTLTTARAIAWYLDAIADLDDDTRQRAPGTPEVTRQGNSLIVADPQRRLAAFLISASAADNSAGPDAAARSPAITIEDHRAGMPGGMHCMHFETVVDANSKNVGLRVSFGARSVRPLHPRLSSDNAGRSRLRESRAPQPPAGQGYAGRTLESLKAQVDALRKQAEEGVAVFKADQRLLRDMDAQDNPELFTNFV